MKFIYKSTIFEKFILLFQMGFWMRTNSYSEDRTERFVKKLGKRYYVLKEISYK